MELILSYPQCPAWSRSQTGPPHRWPQHSSKSQHQRGWGSSWGSCRHSPVWETQPHSPGTHQSCVPGCEWFLEGTLLSPVWTSTHCVLLHRSQCALYTAESQSLLTALSQTGAAGALLSSPGTRALSKVNTYNQYKIVLKIPLGKGYI